MRKTRPIKVDLMLSAAVAVALGSIAARYLIRTISDLQYINTKGHDHLAYLLADLLFWTGFVLSWVLGFLAFRAYQNAPTVDHDRVLCARCGYDLRGSIAAQATHCPECGELIKHPT